MLGSGKPIDYFDSQIRTVGVAHLHRVEIGAMKGCLNVWRGKAYFEKLRLKRLFEDLILENQGRRFVSTRR